MQVHYACAWWQSDGPPGSHRLVQRCGHAACCLRCSAASGTHRDSMAGTALPAKVQKAEAVPTWRTEPLWSRVKLLLSQGPCDCGGGARSRGHRSVRKGQCTREAHVAAAGTGISHRVSTDLERCGRWSQWTLGQPRSGQAGGAQPETGGGPLRPQRQDRVVLCSFAGAAPSP